MSFIYNRAALKLVTGVEKWDGTLTYKIALVGNTYTPDRDHDFMADVTELVATGYTGGFGGASRISLTTLAATEDDANDRAKLDADDVTWNAIGSVAAPIVKGAVIHRAVTSDALSPLIAYIDGGPFPFAANGGNFTIQWDAVGLWVASTV